MMLPRLTCLVLFIALAACGGKDKDVILKKIRNKGNGPDEFSILPSKPLQAPESYSQLPTPAPGNANLTDQDPIADGIIALGGKPQSPSGIATTETALVRHAGRFGAPTGIRQTLAAEDKELRRRHGKVNIFNIGPNDDYTAAYRKHWLDGYAEQDRLRRRGVQTPAAPPAP